MMTITESTTEPADRDRRKQAVIDWLEALKRQDFKAARKHIDFLNRTRAPLWIEQSNED